MRVKVGEMVIALSLANGGVSSALLSYVSVFHGHICFVPSCVISGGQIQGSYIFLHAVFRTQVLQFCVISGVAMQRMLSASPALGGFFSSWRAQYTSTSLLL